MFKFELKQTDETEDEGTFESADGSKWIVAVDCAGNVSVLKCPNIHHDFFDWGYTAEDIGLPPDMCAVDAGVYEWTCSLEIHRDWESDVINGYEFEVTESKLLWKAD